MNRRDILQAVLPTSAAVTVAHWASAVSAGQQGGAALANGRELYEWRTYKLSDNGQQSRLHQYLETACLPAWQRMGLGPVGAFTEIGPNAGPSIHVLLVYPTPQSLASSREALEQDAGYREAAAEYLAAKKEDPAFDRIESSLLVAFAGAPQITPPAKKPRVLEVRTYENHGEDRARAKVQMFDDGEIGIFPKCGFENVFFGETLIGPNLPNLKYMLAAPSMEANEAGWKKFLQHPDFRRMVADPKYAGTEPKITKLFLEPTPYSQV
ncbi:MAG TPA: NIPSNAP family protein [Lacipirellula sp.]